MHARLAVHSYTHRVDNGGGWLDNTGAHMTLPTLGDTFFGGCPITLRPAQQIHISEMETGLVERCRRNAAQLFRQTQRCCSTRQQSLQGLLLLGLLLLLLLHVCQVHQIVHVNHRNPFFWGVQRLVDARPAGQFDPRSFELDPCSSCGGGSSSGSVHSGNDVGSSADGSLLERAALRAECTRQPVSARHQALASWLQFVTSD